MASTGTVSRQWARLAGLTAIFVVALCIRAYQPMARADHWMQRAINFYDALDSQDWETTYQQYHPGVTTMAIGGFTLRVYQLARNSSAVWAEPAQTFFEWLSPPFATQQGRDITAGVLGLSIVISLLIVAACLALARLSGWPTALITGGLLAFSPFFVAQSRIFHVDALMASFMLVSGLLLLVYLESGKWQHLILSGAAAGLALLTKSPALYLLPYAGLVLGIRVIRTWQGEAAPATFPSRLQDVWQQALGPGLVWLAVSAATFGLWPAMWADPLQTLSNMLHAVDIHATAPHPNDRFFAGRIFTPDDPPNRLFYLVVLAFDSSFVELTLAIVALVAYGLWHKRLKLPMPSLTFWLVAAYVGFFAVQMTLGTKQDQRYLLPALVGLVVLAGLGLSALVTLLKERWGTTRLQKRWWSLLGGGTIALQALAGLPYFPDYGAHHNHLLGGNRTAQAVLELADQNEGIYYVGQYLSLRADADKDIIGTTENIAISAAQIYGGAIHTDFSGDYLIINVNHRQRNLQADDWKPALQAYTPDEAHLIVTYDGVNYIELYASNSIEALPESSVQRGGVWLTVAAGVWTAFLIGGIVWAFRYPQPRQDPGRD